MKSSIDMKGRFRAGRKGVSARKEETPSGTDTRLSKSMMFVLSGKEEHKEISIE